MRKFAVTIALAMLVAGCGKNEKSETPVDKELFDEGGNIYVRRCLSCHDISGDDMHVGPPLSGLRDRKAGTVGGFSYTDAMRNSGVVWNAQTLDKYLQDPQAMIPGVAMQIEPVTDPQTRRALIEYLLHQK